MKINIGVFSAVLLSDDLLSVFAVAVEATCSEEQRSTCLSAGTNSHLIYSYILNYVKVKGE